MVSTYPQLPCITALLTTSSLFHACLGHIHYHIVHALQPPCCTSDFNFTRNWSSPCFEVSISFYTVEVSVSFRHHAEWIQYNDHVLVWRYGGMGKLHQQWSKPFLNCFFFDWANHSQREKKIKYIFYWKGFLFFLVLLLCGIQNIVVCLPWWCQGTLSA